MRLAHMVLDASAFDEALVASRAVDDPTFDGRGHALVDTPTCDEAMWLGDVLADEARR